MLVLIYIVLVGYTIERIESRGHFTVKKMEQFKYSSVIDHDNRVQLEWNVYRNQRLIRFKLRLIDFRMPYLVGFGASDYGKFTNADLVVFKVQKNLLTLEHYDAHTDKTGLLSNDTRQNYVLLKDRAKINEVEIIFERKFDTCDEQDYLIETGTVHVIYFLTYDVTLYGRPFNPVKVSNFYDMKQTQLVKSSFFEKSVSYFDETKYRNFQITNDRVTIPGRDTTYWCKVYKLDDRFKSKHHIIAYESVITDTSKGVVHHMELFHCITDPSNDKKSYNGPCNSEEKPSGLTQCRKVIASYFLNHSHILNSKIYNNINRFIIDFDQKFEINFYILFMNMKWIKV